MLDILRIEEYTTSKILRIEEKGGDYLTAAERMKEIVESRGISFTFISEKTGIPINSISRSFLGKRRFPADEMILICRAIGIDLGDFNILQYEKEQPNA